MMKINQPRTVRASRGWQWVNQGTRYFLAYKSQWFLSLMALFSVTLFLYVTSPVFQIFLVIIYPLITAGLSMACFDMEKGQHMSIAYLIKAKDNPNRMNIFRYGLLVIVMIIIAQLFSSVLLNIIGVSNEELNLAMTALKGKEEMTFALIFASPILTKFVIINLLFLLPIMAVNQIAPVLLAFSALTGLNALKLSFQAVMKNAAAFIVYASIYLIFSLILVLFLKMVMAFLIMVLGENSKIALLIYMGLFMVSIMSIVSLSYCSAYVAFKEIFTGED